MMDEYPFEERQRGWDDGYNGHPFHGASMHYAAGYESGSEYREEERQLNTDG